MKLPFLNRFKSKKEPFTLFVASMAFLFAFTCSYSLFDAMREADFLSGKKYEQTDVEEVYAEKQSSPDAALVSPALFSLLLDILFEFLPSFLVSPDTFFLQCFSILRC